MYHWYHLVGHIMYHWYHLVGHLMYPGQVWVMGMRSEWPGRYLAGYHTMHFWQTRCRNSVTVFTLLLAAFTVIGVFVKLVMGTQLKWLHLFMPLTAGKCRSPLWLRLVPGSLGWQLWSYIRPSFISCRTEDVPEWDIHHFETQRLDSMEQGNQLTN